MSMPTSRDEPAVTIENLARNVPRVSKFEGKSKLRGKVNVEGNISPRAILTKDGVKKVDVKTASALLELGSIIDLGKGVFLDADIAASAFGGKVGDQFRYRDIGGEVGIGIGKKISDSGQLGLKGTYRPGRGGQEDDYAVGLSYDRKFNKGGVVDMRQMEMFNIGGLKDEGGSRDSVSGNDVPSGSLKEEVRDDIDAKLSPGEFVFPADVVRYIGLEKLMLMRDKAKKGLKRMEEMGQMGNSEEATLDDDVPFEQSDLLIVAGSPMEEQMNTLNRGGMPIRASNGAFATYGPSGAPTYSTTGTPVTAPGSGLGAGRGDQLLGSNLQQYFNPTTNEIRSVLVSRDNLTGELQPVSPLPEGFIRDTPENRTNAMQPTTTSASVETTRVDPDVLNRASDIGNVRGAPDPSAAGGYQTGATLADMANNPNPNAMSFDQMADWGDTLSTGKMGAFAGKVSQGLAAATRLGFTDLEIAGQKNSIALSNMRKNDEKAYAELQATFDNNLGKNVDKAKDALVDRFSDVMSVRDIEATAKRAYGVTNAQVLAHLSNVSNGNAPVGSQANAIGGYSTTGTQGHTTNANGEVIGKDATEMLSDFETYGITPTEDDLVDFNNGKVNQSMRDRRDKAKRDRETEIEKQEKFAFSMSDEPEGAPDVSTPDTPGTEAQAQDPAETGIAEQEEADDAAAAAAEAAGAFKGGFIPKRKKQKKKMKRGGLASRK